MPRPRALVDTAALARAFAADGLHGTPIEAVVAACGVAKPTLYARGGDKEEWFALAVEAEVERLLSRLGRSPARALDDHLRESPEGMRLLLVTARHTRSRVADRVDESLRRVSAAVGDVLLGAAYAALLGGPSVVGGGPAAPRRPGTPPPPQVVKEVNQN
jgi:AcrR family transcriptional regulator